MNCFCRKCRKMMVRGCFGLRCTDCGYSGSQWPDNVETEDER